MNAHTDLKTQINAAELAGDAYALASIARQLLFQRPPAAPTLKPATDKPLDVELLTYTERRALGLPPAREAKRDQNGTYKFVLVTFANGVRMLAGMYPRIKQPHSLTPAMASARARYLLIVSGGRFIDAARAKRVPRIVSARHLIDAAEIELERFRCVDMRAALEAFAGETWRVFERDRSEIARLRAL